jgi:hypothetical protein
MMISYEAYSDIKSRITEFESRNNRKPKYVTLNGIKIMEDQYNDMIKRVEAFISSNGRNPNIVRLSPLPDVTKPEAVRIAEAIFGMQINNAGDLYKALWNKGRYLCYYSDVFDNAQAWKRVKNEGINCTDYAQMLKPVLEGIGYQVRFEHVYVFCNPTKKHPEGIRFGHIILNIKGREYGNWTDFDAVDAAKTKKHRVLGGVCCNYKPKIHRAYYNEIPRSWKRSLNHC